MTGKKIWLLIGGLLILIGVGIAVLAHFQQQEKTQEIDEKMKMLQQKNPKNTKQTEELSGKEEDLYQDLSNVFGGEGYEQIDGEFWFTAEGF